MAVRRPASGAQIIAQVNGTMPFFYLQCIVPMTDCRLVDGFTYALAGNTVLAPLRIDDDDVVGTFKHTGNTGALVAQVKMKVVPVIP